MKSEPLGFNSGVVQGSVLGPIHFNILASTLQPASVLNRYFKYADDGYLVVPGGNQHTIPLEQSHHASWAASRNLSLNLSKSSEIVFSRRKSTAPPPNPGIDRVSSIKILGVIVDDKLSFQPHVANSLKNAPSHCMLSGLCGKAA